MFCCITNGWSLTTALLFEMFKRMMQRNKFHYCVQSCMGLIPNFKVLFTPPRSDTDFIWLIYTTHPWKRVGWSLHHVCNLTLQLYTPTSTHPSPWPQTKSPKACSLDFITQMNTGTAWKGVTGCREGLRGRCPHKTHKQNRIEFGYYRLTAQLRFCSSISLLDCSSAYSVLSWKRGWLW